jgi:hypothetical protein
MPTSDERGLLDELITVRDWLRYAVTSMTPANLVYGHGTTSAVDEAAFLLLATLNLPIDNVDPWLDARLTTAERQAIAAVISKRIETRKPAAYLTNTAYIQGRKFYVDDRVIVPRSLIGELLAQDRLAAVVPDALAVNRVLDLCTGSGCIAILAAEAFPSAEIHASDISDDALAVAERNIRDYRLGARVRTFKADLFDWVREATISLSRILRRSRRRPSRRFRRSIEPSRNSPISGALMVSISSAAFSTMLVAASRRTEFSSSRSALGRRRSKRRDRISRSCGSTRKPAKPRFSHSRPRICR